MRFRILLIVIAIVIILALAFLFLRGPAEAEIRVAVGPSHQTDAQAAPDGAGGSFIVWLETKDEQTRVMAQRVDGRGRPYWRFGGIPVVRQSGLEKSPTVINSGTDMIVAWARQDQQQLDLFIQKISAEGKKLWGRDGRILAGDDGDQFDAQLEPDDKGGVFAAYTDFRAGGSRIRLQRLDARGRHLRGPGKPVDTGDAFSARPYLTLVKNEPVVAWEQQDEELEKDLLVQRFNRQGRPQWGSDGRVLVDARRQQEDVRLVPDSAGGLYAAWEDNRGKDVKVFTQRLDEKGKRQWSKQGVAVGNAKGAQWHPEITVMEKDLFVAWKDRRTADDIYIQQIDPRGRRLLKAGGSPVSTAKKEQDFFKLGADDDFIYLVWRDDRGKNRDIYAQKVDLEGRSLWEKNGIEVSTERRDQNDPQIAVSNSAAFIVWNDFRANKTKSDVYLKVLR